MISIMKKWKKKEMREKEKKNRDRENGKAVIVILSTVGWEIIEYRRDKKWKALYETQRIGEKGVRVAG